MGLLGLSQKTRRLYAGYVVRRLFSTFAHGAPGAGLLLLRTVAGTSLVIRAVVALRSGPPLGPSLLEALIGVIGILLILGFWTPVAGILLAVLAFLSALLRPPDLLSWILLSTVGAALALLGPGGWSVDARLFGWKRVELPDRNS